MTCTPTTLQSAHAKGGHPADELARRVSPATVIRREEPLAKRTTLRVGGPAEIYIEPAMEADLVQALHYCRERGLPWFVLGRGSNLLVRDGGVRGVVICLAQPHFTRVEVAAERLRCGAGARLKAVAVEAKRHGLAGLEFLEGIPGSVGGALRMNAGAMGCATFDLLERVRLLTPDGEFLEAAARDIEVSYRSCATLQTRIAVEATFRGRRDTPAAIEQRMNEFSRKRWQSQPAAPSAGCIFKNPATIPAGKLMDELGLKGLRVGGARVSAEHANFIVTDGAATARDVLGLIAMIRERVRAARGLELETEVEIIGQAHA